MRAALILLAVACDRTITLPIPPGDAPTEILLVGAETIRERHVVDVPNAHEVTFEIRDGERVEALMYARPAGELGVEAGLQDLDGPRRLQPVERFRLDGEAWRALDSSDWEAQIGFPERRCAPGFGLEVVATADPAAFPYLNLVVLEEDRFVVVSRSVVSVVTRDGVTSSCAHGSDASYYAGLAVGPGTDGLLDVFTVVIAFEPQGFRGWQRSQLEGDRLRCGALVAADQYRTAMYRSPGVFRVGAAAAGGTTAGMFDVDTSTTAPPVVVPGAPTISGDDAVTVLQPSEHPNYRSVAASEFAVYLEDHAGVLRTAVNLPLIGVLPSGVVLVGDDVWIGGKEWLGRANLGGDTVEQVKLYYSRAFIHCGLEQNGRIEFLNDYADVASDGAHLFLAHENCDSVTVVDLTGDELCPAILGPGAEAMRSPEHAITAFAYFEGWMYLLEAGGTIYRAVPE